jgi:hypothetical protein
VFPYILSKHISPVAAKLEVAVSGSISTAYMGFANRAVGEWLVAAEALGELMTSN